MALENWPISRIVPYPNNPRKNDKAVAAVAESIRQCGYIAPIVVDEYGVVLAGHTRLKALKELDYETADVLVMRNLSPEQKRKYRLLDNKTGELAGWDTGLLAEELNGLDLGELSLNWDVDESASAFDSALDAARCNGEKDADYESFEDKFKPKLTTDDCFTPPLVYEAVQKWAVQEYFWQDRQIVRPFYPGGDYESYSYPKNCVVIDNPPFSIISKIVAFYAKRGIDYFLFAPHLVCLGIRAAVSRVITGTTIIYENGAEVNSSFVCSIGPTVRTAPKLYQDILDAVAAGLEKAERPGYVYPDAVLTASKLAEWSKRGIDYRESRASFIRALDMQRENKKSIYGSGYLVPPEPAVAAAVAAAAAAAAAAANPDFVWELSDREQSIVDELAREPKNG